MVGGAGETVNFDTMKNRRRFIGAMAGGLLSMRFPAATAQAGKVPRIGFLLFNSPQAEPIGPLLQGLEAMGYMDGKTIAIEYRFAEGKPERLPDLAAELVQLKSLEVRRPDDFDRALKAALAERAEGLVIVSSRLMSRQRQQIAEFAAKNRIIVAGGWGEWTKDGALLTYGPNTTELMQRVATYVAKILKGARPADPPMERPTHFDLVIKPKKGKLVGLT